MGQVASGATGQWSTLRITIRYSKNLALRVASIVMRAMAMLPVEKSRRNAVSCGGRGGLGVGFFSIFFGNFFFFAFELGAPEVARITFSI